jgi:cyclohexadienyl dehydratase
MHFIKPVALVGLGLLLGVTQAPAAQFANASDDLQQLAGLVKARLALMPDVAKWKAVHRVAVRDSAREQLVLDQVVKQASEFGLDAGPVRDFFRVQIDAASRIEAEQIEHVATEPTGEIKDLTRELRPRLDAIGKQILVRLYLVAADVSRDRSEIARQLQMPELQADESQALANAIGRMHIVHPASLEAIRKSGVLRIGSTGDYAPFSVAKAGELQGSDIDAATQFAQSLGLVPRFERTTWKSLSDDARNHRFDIAVGGISVTPERAAIAQFTTPYHRGGKTPLVRCGTEASFDTLAEIDSPTVRVIVNPGGTNEQFAREHFKQARLVIFPDNTTIFEELAAGRADVMVTDDVEAELQAQLNPRLCRATQQTFTQSAKAWMVIDPELLQRANDWLKAHPSVPTK